MRPHPDPFRDEQSGQAAIREALDAIDKMERDARERRAKRDERKPRPQER